MVGFFDSDLWEVLILQLCQSEPAIRHAVISLTALHEAEEINGMAISKDRLNDSRHRFAVQEYNGAIRHLNRKSQNGGADLQVITLMACLVFIHIELLRGRYDEAVKHLQSGLAILKLSPGDPHESQSITDSRASVNAQIRMAFQRLDLQSAFFDAPRPRSHLDLYHAAISGLQGSNKIHFESLPQARAYIEMLVNATLHFTRSCETMSPCDKKAHDRKLVDQQAQLLTLHTVCLHELGTLSSTLDQPSSSKYRQGAILLHMHLLTSLILLSACMAAGKTETIFDRHLASFDSIVSLAEGLTFELSHPTSSTSKQGIRPRGSHTPENRMPSFVTDWGVVPPLYFTTTKCRHPHVRHRALRILNAWPHREGFWDGALASRLAEEVMRMEEGCRSHLGTIPPNGFGDAWASPNGSCGSGDHGNETFRLEDELPDWARVGNVFFEIAEDQTHGTLTLQKKLVKNRQHSHGISETRGQDHGDEKLVAEFRKVAI
ncbi:MAG: hypothetical protein M1818_004109 [Claussenomyces sp. TS43310]|nr:MAG: hypothetical protein M1818_004109 [Claussenomyces sp. TS43310]